MSEFKFICPVCGQHMMCDSSQAKTVMECPTCFQKITAPQASAPDAKFILTGTKVSQRPLASLGGQDSKVVPFPKKNAFKLILVLCMMGVIAADIYMFRGRLAPPRPAASPAVKTNSAPVSPSFPEIFARGRYMRVVITGLIANKWASFYEFCAFGYDSTN